MDEESTCGFRGLHDHLVATGVGWVRLASTGLPAATASLKEDCMPE